MLPVVAGAVIMSACATDPSLAPRKPSGFPASVEKIIVPKCAISGCHNTESRDAASGLALETWDQLFEGTRDNSAVVPFRPDFSFLMFFVNTYSDLGPSIIPTMPLDEAPLTRDEVTTLRDWILAGAPNDKGEVMFSGDPDRKKVYVFNQGCDNVAVIDAATNLIMRYVDIGHDVAIESPHRALISPNGKYFYVCYTAGQYFQKYSTEDESLAGEVNLGTGNWNSFAISDDGSKAYVIDWSANGTIAVVDLINMKVLVHYKGSGLFQWPHGSAMRDVNTLYVTAQTGNFMYKIDVSNLSSPDIEEIILQPGEPKTVAPKYDPHDVRFSPDRSQYAVTCQKSNEVRFFNSNNDQLIATVPVGTYPQEIEFSTSTDYVFVSCMEDQTTTPGKRGSVAVINYKTHALVKLVYTGFQPHGLIPDDEKQWVYVANRNAVSDGPAPHHTTECGGRNGYLTILDMNTLELVPGYKAELSVDPYAVVIRE